MRKILFINCLAPGDVVVMTAAIRDLHKTYPNKFKTDVRSTAQEIWENNPYISKLKWKEEELNGQTKPNKNEVLFPKHNFKITKLNKDLEIINCDYDGDYPASINHSNENAYHFLHAYAQDLNKKLRINIKTTKFKGDIYINDEEKSWISQLEEMGITKKFWILIAGGKFDFTTKWWNPFRYQEIVDHFKGKILFVQCGEKHHFHSPLKNTINLIGKTNIRQFIRLMYHAEGVICPVTFAMHLAAAIPAKNKVLNKPCIVIAGGREPTQWEAYPHHQYISTSGTLECCIQGGCWKSRCQIVGDGEPADLKENLCSNPIQLTKSLSIPKCMNMISTQHVIERVKFYYDGGILKYE